MGFLGKLFEKKECGICGGEIGLLGNRKLEDGNLCKACAGKLSPWFDQRRHSTVEQIRAQLNYREENRGEVARFHTTRTFGRGYTLCLDEDQKKFLVARTGDLAGENPDVLDYDQVTGCDLDIQEDRAEEKREVSQPDGETQEVSYDPPRYTYSYDFYMIIRVNHPYFDDIRFKLNRTQVELRPAGGQGMDLLGGMLRGIAGAMDQAADPRMQNPDYAEYYTMGQEIKAALTQAREEARQAAAQANAPKTAVTCPWCGATTTPDAAGKCEFCGGAVNG